MKNSYKDHVLRSIKKASEEGVLLYKTETPDKPVTWDQIVKTINIKEDNYYNLQFIVKDEEGKLKEMWFGDEKGKGKKGRGR